PRQTVPFVVSKRRGANAVSTPAYDPGATKLPPRIPTGNAIALPNPWFRTVDRSQGFESWSALFVRENGRREQNHVHESNERHCDIVCRQIQWRERDTTLHLESKVDKQSANYGED